MNKLLHGPTVRMARARLGLQQSDLARLVGVSQTTMSLWESGQRNVTEKRQAQLARALGNPRGLFQPVTKP
jgi:transcriptional regulator with XRE-family HTH domain